jgi:hypothetical protein
MKQWLLTLTLTSTVALGSARPIPENEIIKPLLEGQKEITSLQEMARLNLNSGNTTIDLWSGHYWPHFQGSLAVRYRDQAFISLIKNKEQFSKFKELAEKKPLYTYSGKENLLSPAEKYDLLVGDDSFSLTKYSWEISEKAMNLAGNVPTWRGICDGWSAASQMMPRPVRSVTVKTPKGQPITFYPEDLKALGSLLYGRAQNEVIFLGKRCRSQVLGTFTGACEGTNPAAFHKALINRVGKLKKTFVADVSPGSEVWNYPVKSYKITYYNVFSEEESPNFLEVAESFLKKNRFARTNKRHKNTMSIVGVKATVVYANMREANLFESDGTSMDETLEKTYYYDLELDHSHQILGGEWFGSNRPDFIWAPTDQAFPLSIAEERGLPQSPSEIAAKARISSKEGQPLSVIIQKLFELAK